MPKGIRVSKPIGFGVQVRSYVLQPYQLVKDLRTGVETNDVQGVLDGDLDQFLDAALAMRVNLWPTGRIDGVPPAAGEG